MKEFERTRRRCFKGAAAFRIAAAIACALLIGNRSNGETIPFELTSYVSSFDLSERVVDLGRQFSRIENACVHFEGEYTPGTALATNWIPPRTIRADNFHIIIRLGQPGAAWIDKRVYARPSLQGLTGQVAFELPLYESPEPAFWPGGEATPDFGFMLDGQFGLSVTSILFSLPGDELIEAPQFILTNLILHVDGIPIPEPNGFSIGALAGLCLYRASRRQSVRRRLLPK